MLAAIALIHGTDSCKELAQSARPQAPARDDLRRRILRAERRVA